MQVQTGESRVEGGHIVVTTAGGHGLRPGDVIEFAAQRPAARLYALFTKPRITVVVDCSTSTLECDTRRMTWREWRRAVWSALAETINRAR